MISITSRLKGERSLGSRFRHKVRKKFVVSEAADLSFLCLVSHSSDPTHTTYSSYLSGMIMGTPPTSPPQSNVHSEVTSRNTRQSTRLRRLTFRTLDQPRPVVNVDAATGRASSPNKEIFHNYLGVVEREKISIVHNSWKDVPDSLKELVWNDILDLLKEQMSQGSFVPQGRDDILNTAIGKPDHGGRVRATGSGVTISQYYGRASRGSSSSSITISQEQMTELIGSIREQVKNEFAEEKRRSLETWKKEVKDAIIIEMSQKVSHLTPPTHVDINVLGACVSTKESNAEVAVNRSGEEQVGHMTPTMGFPKQVAESVDGVKDVVVQDPLRELIKCLVDIYDNPVQFEWDSSKFGIPNVDSKLLLTYADVNEITIGDKWLNIAILQLWTMYMDECSSTLGHVSLYGFLEPQSIHNAKDRRGQCEEYIGKWLKESQRQLYLGAYLNQAHWQLIVLCPTNNQVVWFCSMRKRPDVHIKIAINKLMHLRHYRRLMTAKFLKLHPSGLKLRLVPSHVQRGGYKCGYYVMHWTWNIIIGELETDWSLWIGDGTLLDTETITGLRQKWVEYFFKLRSINCKNK
ncbi:hypothetical protein GmHk_10G028023 [Glycine max]|nr:hypothetical protein GmHk_10G028023 [Glycine max]